jgi:hypothetical protein
VAVLAYNNHAITERCVSQVRASGFAGRLILLDNGSQPPLKYLAIEYGCIYVRNASNRFVNPAWNQVFRLCDSQYLTLLNNDCLVQAHYLDEVTSVMQRHGLALASPKAIIVPDILAHHGLMESECAPPMVKLDVPRDGHFITIDMRAYLRCRYHIPSCLRIWYGDDWIFGQLRLHGYLCGSIINRYCIRETSGTISRNPQLHSIIKRDSEIASNSPFITQLRILSGTVDPSALSIWRNRATHRRFITSIRDKLFLAW